MVARENRAELEIFRTARIVDPSFLNKVRAIAHAAFGERGGTRATLRPPLVEEMVAVSAGEPLAKIYDAPNLKLPLLWRISVGDDKAGSKFFKARQALDNGIREKTQHAKQSSYTYRVQPLTDILSHAAEASEIGPNTSLSIACTGITMYRHRLIHPSTDIFCLTPDMTSHAYTGLLTEQAAAEDALAEVSGYVYNKQNPQPQLVIPFMRVDREHSEEQRRDFTEQILTPNIFPLKVVLGHVDLATRN